MTERGKRPIINAIERVAERNRGLNRKGLGFSSMRMSETHIADVSKLPVEEGDVSVENAAGENLFLVGYSVLNGGDVIG